MNESFSSSSWLVCSRSDMFAVLSLSRCDAPSSLHPFSGLAREDEHAPIRSRRTLEFDRLVVSRSHHDNECGCTIVQIDWISKPTTFFP